jgi:hypothetical protein
MRLRNVKHDFGIRFLWNLDEDGDKCRAGANTVTKARVIEKTGICGTDEEPLGCTEGLNCIDLINYLVRYFF